MSSINGVASKALIFIAVVLLALVLKTLKSFLIPFALAVILAFLLLPLIRFSERKKIPFSIALLAMVFIFLIVVGGIGYLIVLEAQQLTQNPLFTQENINYVIGYVNQEIAKYDFLNTGFDMNKLVDIGKMGGTVASFISPVVSALGNFFSMFFTVLLFLVFIIPSYSQFLLQLKKDMAPSKYRRIKASLLSLEKSIRDYLYTKSLVSLGTAIASILVLLAFQSKYIIILGVLFFILNFIPNIGSFIAVAISVLAYLIQYGFGISALILLLLLIVIQFFFGNYIEPKFAGKKLSLSPIIILLSLFIWYYIWGIMGMILAIPLTSMIKIMLSHNSSTRKYSKFME